MSEWASEWVAVWKLKPSVVLGVTLTLTNLSRGLVSVTIAWEIAWSWRHYAFNFNQFLTQSAVSLSVSLTVTVSVTQVTDDDTEEWLRSDTLYHRVSDLSQVLSEIVRKIHRTGNQVDAQWIESSEVDQAQRKRYTFNQIYFQYIFSINNISETPVALPILLPTGITSDRSRLASG